MMAEKVKAGGRDGALILFFFFFPFVLYWEQGHLVGVLSFIASD